ncbi:hypothetical protein DSM112329_01985 [Paraconexibacter sp. AEG42_29]|uniref:DUF998 domain-containing protein n=1 Tax=Paraconexibacter sp. AEG42_29 TaxID=2997339 RepID=A0AAU7AU58_9ACTN
MNPETATPGRTAAQAPPVPEPSKLRLATTGLSTRTQIACAWSGLGLIVVVVAGFLLIAGFLPPRYSSDSAQQIAAYYADNTDRIRIGVVLGFVGWTPWAALTAVIAVQLARMQPYRPVLAVIQLVTGAAGFIFLTLSTIILLVATFRPERSPEITQALHDLGWFTLFITVPAFSTQALVIGIATLRNDPPVQVYPRWFGYVNIWVAILFVPALMMPFFKSGPFSWQGALVYWLAFIVFFIWILVMFYVIRRAALDEAAEEARAATAAVPG